MGELTGRRWRRRVASAVRWARHRTRSEPEVAAAAAPPAPAPSVPAPSVPAPSVPDPSASVPPATSTAAVDGDQPSSPDPFAGFGGLLPRARRLTVAVVADPTSRTQIGPWIERFAGHDVHLLASSAAPEWELEQLDVTFHPADGVGPVARQLKLLGPVHVLVDVTAATASEHEQLWRRCFLHLAPGGLHVLDRRSEASATFANAIARWYGGLVDADDPDTPPSLRKVTKELVSASAGLVVTRDLVLVTKRIRHYLKVRHDEAHQVLAAREPALGIEVLQRLPKGVLTSSATVTQHQSDTEIDHLDPALPYPQLTLRHYTGSIAFAGSGLFYTGASILPDSFRHHLITEPVNPKIISVSPSFARIPWSHRPTQRLAGSYYNLDSAYSGHFGHLTTEVLSRLWGWDVAKREVPDLKALIHIDHENQRDPSLERRLFAAYGIDPDDIVCLTEPAILESVVSATPMWHNAVPHYVHPQMRQVWSRLTDRLIDPSTSTHDRIFVSRGRQLKRRACRNVDQVEQFFADRGFTIVFPEQLDLGEQVALFAGASTIAGFGGSAMFNIMHAQNLKTLILLSHESYTARNEHLFTALLGGSVHYFWSRADVEHPENAWTQGAFTSDWEFDFARNTDDLEDVIASL